MSGSTPPRPSWEPRRTSYSRSGPSRPWLLLLKKKKKRIVGSIIRNFAKKLLCPLAIYAWALAENGYRDKEGVKGGGRRKKSPG